MEIQQYNQLTSQLLRQAKALTIELYDLFSLDQRKEIYKQWLTCEGYTSASAYVNFYPKDIKSSHNIDLFDFSNNEELLELLPEQNLNIDDDIKKTSNCKSAYKKYRSFLSLLKNQKILFNITPIPRRTLTNKRTTSNNIVNVKTDWELWNEPSEEELLIAAKIITKYAKFLNPDIIEAITEDNNIHRNNWISKLIEKNIDPDIYLWENSPCAFPGVRRYTGSAEVASHRGHKTLSNEIADALRIDDNDYPKHIWSFIFRGKPFQKKGPDSYSLAHIIDHKEHKSRILEEFDVEGSKLNHKVFGLHSCPTNSVYVPISFLKPTDHSIKLRQLFLQKAHSLYNKQCNPFPNWMKLKVIGDEKWNIENFEWGSPVGSVKNLSLFLKYRNNFMEKILSNELLPKEI